MTMFRRTMRLAAGLAAAGTFVAVVAAAPAGAPGRADPAYAGSSDARVASAPAALTPSARIVSKVVNPVTGQTMYHPVNTVEPGI
jgi:hypothetical protein